MADYIGQPTQHNLVTGQQRFQHPTYHQIDRNGRIVDAVFFADGAIVVPPTDNTIVAVVPGGGNLSMGADAVPIKPFQHWTRSVIVRSQKSDGTPNSGLVWIGSQSEQSYILMPGEFIQMDAPNGRAIDLNKIYVRSNIPGTQINYLTMD